MGVYRINSSLSSPRSVWGGGSLAIVLELSRELRAEEIGHAIFSVVSNRIVFRYEPDRTLGGLFTALDVAPDDHALRCAINDRMTELGLPIPESLLVE